MMGRRTFSVLLIVLAVALSIVSSRIQRTFAQTNTFFLLFLLELLAVPLGGMVAGSYLARRYDHARALLSVGLDSLLVAAAIGGVFPIWLPQDNTILGSALLAGLLAGVGAGLALASAAALAGWPSTGMVLAGIPGAVLVFVLITASGMVAPLNGIWFPVLVAILVTLATIGLAWRQRRRLLLPLAWAVGGAVTTIGVLIARGPSDWASASTSAKLYSFPIVLLTLGISLVILDIIPPDSPAQR